MLTAHAQPQPVTAATPVRLADDRGAFQWRGSLGAFFADNEFTEGEIAIIRSGLATLGSVHISGGAAPLFTLAREIN